MKMAFELWAEAADRGQHARSDFALGVLFQFGRGVPMDQKRAKAAYVKSRCDIVVRSMCWWCHWCSAAQCSAVQRSAAQCSAVQRSAAQCSAVQRGFPLRPEVLNQTFPPYSCFLSKFRVVT